MRQSLPSKTIYKEDIPEEELPSNRLTTQGQDKQLEIPEIDLSVAESSAVIHFYDAVTIIGYYTRVKNAQVNSGDDPIITLYNNGHADAIGTITILKTAAEYELDTGTSPHSTYKEIVAGTFVNVQTTTVATVSGKVSLVLVYRENE